MDTLASVAALFALAVQVLSQPRVFAHFGFAGSTRPWIALTAVMILSVFAAVGGIAGYRREWPRWANGRALFGAVVGALLIVVSTVDIILRLG